jgi:hypothetical protein
MTRTYVRKDNTGAVLLGALILILVIGAAWWLLTYGTPSLPGAGTQPGAQPPAPAATSGY